MHLPGPTSRLRNPFAASAPTIAHLIAATLLAVLASCGGGVDSGGTGGASYASGPISGFGSVVVNNVRFDDTSATVTDDDGVPRSRDDLRLGMTTEIRGSTISTDSSGASVSNASTITFGSEINGRIDSIDRVGARLVVLGQTVATNPATVFDSASVGGGLAALAPGDLLEVYALLDAATGHYTATRIERKSTAPAFKLRGVVSGLDAVTRAFNIGSERISYAGAAAPAFSGLANGSIVRVRLQPAKLAGVWQVTTLAEATPKPRDADEVRLEGIVNTFASATRFSVDGVAVDAESLGAVAGLALGARVEVEGVSRAGVLVAARIKVKSPGEVAGTAFELRGAVASVSAAQSSFVLRGVTVGYSATTDFRNGSAASLAAGVNVEARGVLSSDGTRLLASRITFR